MAAREEGTSPEREAGNGIPRRPDVDLPPEILTVAATGAAIVASAMTLPIFVQSFSWSGTPEGPGPSGLPSALWTAAILIGVPSMVLALVARRRERRRGSQVGRKLAGRAVWVAILGSFLSGWSLLVAASAGL